MTLSEFTLQAINLAAIWLVFSDNSEALCECEYIKCLLAPSFPCIVYCYLCWSVSNIRVCCACLSQMFYSSLKPAMNWLFTAIAINTHSHKMCSLFYGSFFFCGYVAYASEKQMWRFSQSGAQLIIMFTITVIWMGKRRRKKFDMRIYIQARDCNYRDTEFNHTIQPFDSFCLSDSELRVSWNFDELICIIFIQLFISPKSA